MSIRKHHKTLFKNEQWKVTRYGMATRSNDYELRADWLPETREVGGQRCYDVMLHMAEKREWVMKKSFNEAFLEAMIYHHGI